MERGDIEERKETKARGDRDGAKKGLHWQIRGGVKKVII